MKTNLNTGLSKLSNIDENILNKLSELESYLIGEAIKESQLKNDLSTEIDLGWGTLFIKHDTEDLKFKIVPCSELIEDIVNISKGKESNLIKKINKSLVAKLIESYKEMI